MSRTPVDERARKGRPAPKGSLAPPSKPVARGTRDNVAPIKVDTAIAAPPAAAAPEPDEDTIVVDTHDAHDTHDAIDHDDTPPALDEGAEDQLDLSGDDE